MKNVLLSAENITKSFISGDNRLEVLKGVDFRMRAGEIVILTGASGSGKSTLLNILAGIELNDSGRVFLNDMEISACTERESAEIRNREIGFVFQFHHLLEDFTILENVMMPSLISGKDFGEARADALKILDILKLTDRSDHKPAQVSGGEAQRVAVARALINKPNIVLADEPTGNLDRKNGETLVELISNINKNFGVAFLIATHNQELLPVCRRLLLMDGKISEN